LGVSGTGTWSLTQDTDVPSGQGFANSLKASCTAAATPTGTQQVFISQNVEAQFCQHLKYGTSNAEKITMSFWVKSNKTGNYIAWILCDDVSTTNTNYVYSINAADTWEKKTITFQGNTLQSIANDNGKGLQIRWTVASGETYTSGTTLNGAWQAYNPADTYAGLTVNLADSTSNYINITGVQLEVGDTATPFEVMPYDMQLQRCMRYYEKSYSYSTSVGTATNTGGQNTVGFNPNDLGATTYYKVTKRASPTVTPYASNNGTANAIVNYSTGGTVTGVGVEGNENGFRVYKGSSITAGQYYAYQWQSVAEL
jgi:hypothetical protein